MRVFEIREDQRIMKTDQRKWGSFGDLLNAKLFGRDYSMRISKAGPDVIRFQIRVVREDGLRSFPLSKQTENKFDRDAHAPNDRFATKKSRGSLLCV